MQALLNNGTWQRLDVPSLGLMFRRTRSLSGSLILVEYRRHEPNLRPNTAEELPPVPLADGPLRGTVARA
jgi:hypothetical protein